VSAFQNIKEYLKQVSLGVRNFQYFRLNQAGRLVKTFSAIEKRVLITAILALVISASFLIVDSYFTATKQAPDYGGRFVEGLVGQPRYINPVLSAASNVDSDITRIVYSGLYRFHSDQSFVPDLAASMPEISADQKQYTIHLRDDVYWHDGEKFSADDVVFTIQLIQNQAYNSPVRLNWNRVEVQKIDPTTVVLSLNEPTAAFATNLTQGIIPKHIWENVEAGSFALSRFNLEAVGTGPFQMKDIVKSDEGEIRSLTLTANLRYQPHRPYLDEVVFKFYETYDDMIAAYHSRDIMGIGYIPFDKKIYIEKSSRIELHNIHLPQYQALFFNKSKSDVLSDKNVRSALTQSVNRQQIIEEAYQGAAEPSFGPIPPGYLGYNPGVEEANKYDLENAKKLLTDAGFVSVEGSDILKKGDVDLEFTITLNNFPLNVQVAELLKSQWEKIGFKVNLEILTIGELEQDHLRPREYQALLFSENIGADPDPYLFWHSTQRVDPGLNLGMLNNKEADDLLAEAHSNADPEYRRPRYERFQEIMVDEMPAVFIVSPSFVYGLNEKVKGFDVTDVTSQSDRFTDIYNWYINEKRSVKN